MKPISRFALMRRSVALEAKLWAVDAALRWNKSRADKTPSGPNVLDQLRANQAQDRRIEELSLRRDDIVGALELLALAQTPFFEV